jgi:hypothetical protein
MKRCFLLSAFVILGFLSSGNVLPPTAYISEVLVTDYVTWSIEIGFFEYSHMDLDSIIVESSTGRSKIMSLTLFPAGGFPSFDSLAVITYANLSHIIYFNPMGDYVRILSYSYGGWLTSDYVAYGNYPGSELDCMNNGQSVNYIDTFFGDGFFIDSSPTIGLPNDDDGSYSILSGTIFNLTGSVFTEGHFTIPSSAYMFFNISPDGSFSDYLLSSRIHIDTVVVFIPGPPSRTETYTVEPIDTCLIPYATYHADIVTTSLVTNITKPPTAYKKITPSPNPFTNTIDFFINLKGLSENAEYNLVILNPEGKQLEKIGLTVNQTNVQWTPNVSLVPGTLVYQLISKGQCMESGKLIKR